jgi:hypothetical protein
LKVLQSVRIATKIFFGGGLFTDAPGPPPLPLPSLSPLSLSLSLSLYHSDRSCSRLLASFACSLIHILLPVLLVPSLFACFFLIFVFYVPFTGEKKIVGVLLLLGNRKSKKTARKEKKQV